MMSILRRLSGVLICVILAGASRASGISSAEMQIALQSHRCPTNAAEQNFLSYYSCGSQGLRPNEASETYLQCKNDIDATNNIIAAYNDFIRSCPPPPKLSITQVPIDHSNAMKMVEPYAHIYSPQECHRHGTIMVCTSSKDYTNAFKDLYRGQCLDIRELGGGKGARICHQPSDYFFDQKSHPNYTFDFCVDVICIPKDTRPYY